MTTRTPGGRHRLGWPSLVIRLGYVALTLGLISLNAWWWWADRPPVDMRTIDLWLAAGRTADAERALRQQIARSRFHGEAMMKLARLVAKRDDYLGCARILRGVPDWWPAKAEALFIEGQSFKQVDRIRDAVTAWKACVAGDPLHPIPPHYQQGAARELIGTYILEGRIDEARLLLMKAYELAAPSEHVDVLIMRMRAELERVAHEEAVSKLRSFVAADPGDWEARRALALEEQLSENPDAADVHIQACLDARPTDTDVWRTLLEILHQRGARDEIKAAVDRLPPSADDDAEIWKFRGLVREWNGKLESAADAFRRASELNPREGEYFYKLGIVEQRLGRSVLAADHLEQSRILRKIDSDLDDAYHRFLALSQNSHPGDPSYDAEVKVLASLCERMGWKREAEAWRKVIAAN